MNDILVPISPGELLDKITILRIKSTRMADESKLANVRHELARLEASRQAALPPAELSCFAPRRYPVIPSHRRRLLIGACLSPS